MSYIGLYGGYEVISEFYHFIGYIGLYRVIWDYLGLYGGYIVLYGSYMGLCSDYMVTFRGFIIFRGI